MGRRVGRGRRRLVEGFSTRAGLLDEVAVEFPGEVEPVHGEVEAVVAVAALVVSHVFHLDRRPLVVRVFEYGGVLLLLFFS